MEADVEEAEEEEEEEEGEVVVMAIGSLRSLPWNVLMELSLSDSTTECKAREIK